MDAKRSRHSHELVPNATRGTYNTHLKTSISVERVVNLRIEGCSFSELADLFQITKSSAHNLLLAYQKDNYSGYEPIPVAKLKEALDSSRPMRDIALEYGVCLKGLQNYISDRQIPDRITIDNIKAKIDLMSRNELADYLGIDRTTLYRFLKRCNIE